MKLGGNRQRAVVCAAIVGVALVGMSAALGAERTVLGEQFTATW